jgi:D-3-phosphoglycerate dehydrogenase
MTGRQEAVRIVVPDDFPAVYGSAAHPELTRLERDPRVGSIELYGTRAVDADELVARLEGVQALINVRSYSAFSADVLARLPQLRLISILGTGTDNIDLAAATRQGVLVTNTPGASTVSVAELTIALMFAASRHLALMDRRVRQGDWYHREGMELREKTLGVVGLGAIGQEVARLGQALGMKVLGWSLHNDAQRATQLGIEQAINLGELLLRSDVVSLHLRASDQTVGIIGREQLKLMKPAAVLVNTARGALVDEAALIEALKEGWIAAAGLDAYSQEPLGADNPFLGVENVVLSPHVGWVTPEASGRLMRMPVDNILAWLHGRPQHVVNAGVPGHS